MTILRALLVTGLILLPSACSQSPESPSPGNENEFVGSSDCRSCHERFYKKWENSHHGQAMQLFTPGLTGRVVPEEPIQLGEKRYGVAYEADQGWIIEKTGESEKRFRMLYALGGKNVYFFLTELDRGMLQVLPISFDVRAGSWYGTTGSMVRGFHEQFDEAVDWTDRLLTFNTSCYGCHVSQVTTNYDSVTDSYRTVWEEPGVNCETCHGPGGEHVRVCKEAGDGKKPDDLKIIITASFDNHQTNSMCGPCHAKMYPISSDFMPGDLYFDHFGLNALEDRDFYPDGRDLGENYTYTQWLMNSCARKGTLDCVDCHTSSGRNRHADAPDNACMPCHDQYVTDPEPHTHHAADSEGSRCVSCHMPQTTFARMVRHDHSFLAPTPAATMEFGSPNACNICHENQKADWSDRWVRKWYTRDYQEPVLERARLIEAARKGDWSGLDQMLAYLSRSDRDPVFTASLVRLLEDCPDEHKWPTLRQAMSDPSPLVRSAAAAAMGLEPVGENRQLLLAALADETRLVQITSAAGLSQIPIDQFSGPDRAKVQAAFAAYQKSLESRPDDWASCYSLGNFYASQGNLQKAVSLYEKSGYLRPDAVPPLVNMSMAQARLGRMDDAESSLRKALSLNPQNAGVNFNLGLLLAEREQIEEAEACLRQALKSDPQFAEAAFNLGVLLGGQEAPESISWCRKAFQLRPQNDRYGYTLAYQLARAGKTSEAVKILNSVIALEPADSSPYLLLADVLQSRGEGQLVADVFEKAAGNSRLNAQQRSWFRSRAEGN